MITTVTEHHLIDAGATAKRIGEGKPEEECWFVADAQAFRRFTLKFLGRRADFLLESGSDFGIGFAEVESGIRQSYVATSTAIGGEMEAAYVVLSVAVFAVRIENESFWESE